jgi:hypothetical protein
VKTFVIHVVIEEDPFEDGRMAHAAYVPELKSLGAARIPHGSLRAMPCTPESRLRDCVSLSLLDEQSSFGMMCKYLHKAARSLSLRTAHKPGFAG